MANKTSPFDWVEDVCVLTNFTSALYENKIYTVGGTLFYDTHYGNGISDSYLRILDFSKPDNSSTNIIDISTDNITTAIRLPDNVPRLEGATLFISDGVMYMLPGKHAYYNIADADGNLLTTTSYRTNLTSKVWSFDLKSRMWDVLDSGTGDRPQYAVVASDAQKQVAWYYGGYDYPDKYYNGGVLVASNGSTRALQDLYQVERGKGTPTKVEMHSLIGNVGDGALVYVEGIGEAGVLVLLGGNSGTQEIELRSLRTVHVFDISSKTWFAQITTAENGIFPTDRIGFCSVVASAEDNSSQNVYIYGGWDQNIVKDDIFILTLPLFHWVSVFPSVNDTSGLDIRQTHSHQCQKVHEKHMVAYRGRSSRCDSDRELQKYHGMAIYDMSSLTWVTKVEVGNPKYKIPEVLYGIIGGNETGGATAWGPRQGFQDLKLSEIFATQVFINITNPLNETTQNTTASPKNDSSSHPVGAIAGGVVGGFFLILAIIAAFLLFRKYKAARPRPPPEMSASTEPQEVQDHGLHELHDAKDVSELPSPLPLPELEGSIRVDKVDSIKEDKADSIITDKVGSTFES